MAGALTRRFILKAGAVSAAMTSAAATGLGTLLAACSGDAGPSASGSGASGGDADGGASRSNNGVAVARGMDAPGAVHACVYGETYGYGYGYFCDAKLDDCIYGYGYGYGDFPLVDVYGYGDSFPYDKTPDGYGTRLEHYGQHACPAALFTDATDTKGPGKVFVV